MKGNEAEWDSRRSRSIASLQEYYVATSIIDP
jgi:hypothetical protein